MLFLMISRKSYFSLLKLNEFLSCPDWRWFVLNRGVFRCAKAGLQFYQFQQSTGRMDAVCALRYTWREHSLLAVHSPPLFSVTYWSTSAAACNRAVFWTILQRKCQPIKQLPCNVQCRKLSVGVNKCCLSASAVLYCQFSSKWEPNVNDTWVIFS